jgi:hypothetical protein
MDVYAILMESKPLAKDHKESNGGVLLKKMKEL